MHATIEDDRTDEQKTTHKFGIAATDRFMGGWGGARGGSSVAIWTTPGGPDTFAMQELERWVAARPEMRRVRLVDLRRYRPGRSVAHVHIYVATPGEHPALRHPAFSQGAAVPQ